MSDLSCGMVQQVIGVFLKTAIFGANSAKLYNYDAQHAGLENDRFAALKADYEREGRDPSNLRYGYVLNG